MRFQVLRHALAPTLVWVLVNPALVSASPGFMGLGFLPGGSPRSAATAVSADGSVVVGWSSSADSAADGGYDNEAFRWSASTGMVGLGDLAGGEFASSATAVSADGSVVVGSGAAGTDFEAFRWTQSTGLIGLGDLPGGSSRSEALGVSADGTIVVGYSGSTASLSSGYYEAFRWAESTGIVGLGDLPGGTFASSAAAISADGSIIVGDSFSIFMESPDGGRAEGFEWTQASGMVGLGELAGGELYSTATDLSADGSIIVGQSSSGPFPTYEAVIWDNAGITGLGDLPGGRFISVARAVSGDGSVVVGSADTGAVPAYDSNTAFIWDSIHGMRALQDVLQSEYGLDLSGWWLLDAKDISDDGRTIVGVGINPSGDAEAWIAILPPACSNLRDDDGDGLADYPDDPGCSDENDGDEHGTTLPCDDGVDNDGDATADFVEAGGGDPGCRSPTAVAENPQCQDGLNNDGQAGIDFDGGDSLDIDPRDGLIDAQFNATTPAVGAADPECAVAYRNKETPNPPGGGCGLGAELALVMPLLGVAASRRRRAN